MNTIASDVAPAVTPSIGRGNAAARVAATSNLATPASGDPLGRSTTRAWIAATAANAPAAATGRTMGSVRLVSAGNKSLDQRRRRRRFRNRLPYGPSARSVMPLAPIAARRKAASAGIQYATEVTGASKKTDPSGSSALAWRRSGWRRVSRTASDRARPRAKRSSAGADRPGVARVRPPRSQHGGLARSARVGAQGAHRRLRRRRPRRAPNGGARQRAPVEPALARDREHRRPGQCALADRSPREAVLAVLPRRSPRGGRGARGRCLG